MEPTTFADLGLSPKVQAAITASGYTIPTPIQAAAIPVALTGRDVLGIAQTGTGKTASFVLPMITRLETGRARARMPRSLIMAPTRELATQVAQSFEKYGINHKLDVALLIGGTDMDKQIQKLDRGADVLVATPGRLLDHFGRGRIMLMGVEILVIDEADRMLDMGFIPDIEKICKLLPHRRQTLFFSATMPAEITRLVNQFLKDPVRIEAAKPATTAKTITQLFKFCPDGEDYAKREILRELIKTGNVKNAIIFCNRKRDVAVLYKSLAKHGFNAGALHGDMEQSARTATLDKFRAGEIMLLAASDVAARGLDIPDVSHVFNFDLPWAGDDYVHRIGRTGRAGKEGHSVSLVSPDDLKFVSDIEKITGETVTWLGNAPTADDAAGAGKRRRGPRGRGAPTSRGGSSASSPRNSGERPRGDRPERTAESSGGGERREARPAASARSERPARLWAEASAANANPADPKPVQSRTPDTRPDTRQDATHERSEHPARAPAPDRDTKREPVRGPERASERASDRGNERGQQRGRERPRTETPGQPREHQPSGAGSAAAAQPDHRPERAPRPPREPRHDAWTDTPKPARKDAARGDRPQEGRDKPRSTQPKGPSPQQGENRVGFQENVPAFMRKSSRPAKAPGRR